MGWISMSERNLKRIEVLTELLAYRRTTESVAADAAASGQIPGWWCCAHP
jgi:hypothetical protein